MPIKIGGVEFGINENEAKILAQVGHFFKSLYKEICEFIKFRCPHCKSRKIFFKDLVGDQPYEAYGCISCGKSMILLPSGFVEVEIT